MGCFGGSSLTCGGNYRLNVYQLYSPSSTVTSTSTTSVKPSTTSVKPSTTSVKPSTTSVKPSATTSVAPVPSASQIGATGPPSASGTKWVWAHHMVGNVCPFPETKHPPRYKAGIATDLLKDIFLYSEYMGG